MADAPSRRLLVAGGGTGGHVLAGVALAEEWLKQTQGQGRVLFVGARGGIEEKIVPKANFPLKTLSIGSLNRVSLAKKLKTIFQLPISFVASLWILVSFRPHAVVGVGGYVSGPVVLMARIVSIFFNIHTAILEQNSVLGMTNRILGRFAHRIYAAFPLPKNPSFDRKVFISGNPIRNSMKPLAPASRDPFTIFIFGGSQGAVGMNTLVIDALEKLKPYFHRIRFVHQTGKLDFERVSKAHQAAGSGALVLPFVEDMASQYQAASLVICRAGSSTLFELAAVRRAALLVPLPTASDDHQVSNAKQLADLGGAILVPQNATSGAQLAEIIKNLIENPSRIDSMEQNLSQFDRSHAAQEIVSDLICSLSA